MILRRLAIASVAIASLVGASAAQGQTSAGVPILQPHETAQLEHDDRRNRIDRLSRSYGFHLIRYEEYLIERSEHGLSKFPADIPVLRVIFDHNVFFDFDRSHLRPEARPILDMIAESLSREPDDVSVFIAGHTDWIGHPDYNFNLGLLRAETVAVELARRGIPQAEIFRVSFGEEVPIADNRTDAGRAANRRVEFLFGARREALVIWMEAQEVPACAAMNETDMRNCRRSLNYQLSSVEVSMESGQRAVDVGGAGSAVDVEASRTGVSIGREVIELDLSRPRRVVRVLN
ncbi:MAG: OmpA family protein [Oceanicaulis sp.]|nr:OmpA family protein [Oceanicaulis sp.]